MNEQIATGVIEPDWIEAGVIIDGDGELARLTDELVRDIEAMKALGL